MLCGRAVPPPWPAVQLQHAAAPGTRGAALRCRALAASVPLTPPDREPWLARPPPASSAAAGLTQERAVLMSLADASYAARLESMVSFLESRGLSLYNTEQEESAVLSSFISTASKAGAHSACSAVFHAALLRGERALPIFNAYIAACARSGRREEAVEAFQRLQQEGVRPTAITFNALIGAHAVVGDAAAARDTFQAMLTAGETPSFRTYGPLLAAHAGGGSGGDGGADARVAADLFEQAEREGVAVNNYLASSLLTALARGCGRTRGFPPDETARLAERCMQRLHACGATPNAQTISALTSAFGRAGAAAQALAAQQEAGELGNGSYVLCATLSACRGSASHAREALRRAAAAPRAARSREVLNSALVLLSGVLGRNRIAHRLLSAMASGRLGDAARPDVISFAPLFSSAASRGDAEEASELYQRMLRAGLAPTGRCAAALLSAVGRGAGGPADARALLPVLLKRHSALVMDEYLYSSLLDAHVKAGDVDGAFAEFESMRKAGVQPTVVTFGILLDGCRRADDVGRALALARELSVLGLALSDTCCNLLIVACSRHGMLDEMLAELRGLSRRGGEVEPASLSVMLIALCRYQYAERALRMRSLMSARGVVPSEEAFSALAEAAAREGLPAAAYQVAVDARKLGFQLAPSARSAVIVALCRAGELEQAIWLADVGSAPPGEAAERGDAAPDTASLLAPRRPPVQASSSLLQAAAPFSSLLPGCAELSPTALCVLAAAAARVLRTPLALQLFAMLLARGRAAGGVGGAGQLLMKLDLKATARLQLYSSLVQACTLSNRLEDALRAFDAAKEDPEAPPNGQLALSPVALAALEAACKRSASEALRLRVFDVCAYLRTVRYASAQRKLAAPSKRYHHGATSASDNAA